ncbi:MAG: hypothetical protein JSR18_13250 [Proteobacteria bacterium]|nr:hypothetical protein [Pseudomonadota bacterium]
MTLPASRLCRTCRAVVVAGVAGCVLASAAPDALAALYKCRGANDTPVYQDTACPAGTELRDFQTDPASVSVVPFEKPAASPPPSSSGRKSRSGDAESRPPRRASTVVRHGKAESAANAAERRFLRRGMTEAEVLARVGAPDVRSGSPSGKGGGRWSYLPQPADPQTITTLTFVHGEVYDIERKMVR